MRVEHICDVNRRHLLQVLEIRRSSERPTTKRGVLVYRVPHQALISMHVEVTGKCGRVIMPGLNPLWSLNMCRNGELPHVLTIQKSNLRTTLHKLLPLKASGDYQTQ